MALILVVAFLVVPLVELYVVVQVGQSIGVLPTIALLFAISIAGGWLVKREGRRVWRAFQSAARAGRAPTREVADGALVLFGGALLLTPGFVTDLLGLALLLPPTRAVVRRTLLAAAIRRGLGSGGMRRVRVRSIRTSRHDAGRDPDVDR